MIRPDPVRIYFVILGDSRWWGFQTFSDNFPRENYKFVSLDGDTVLL